MSAVYVSPTREGVPARSTNIWTIAQFILDAMAGINTRSADDLVVHFCTRSEVLAGITFGTFPTFNETLVYVMELVADEKNGGVAWTDGVAEKAFRHNMATLAVEMMDHLHGLAILEDASRGR